MIKNKQKDNTLIKRKNLVLLLKQNNLRRVSPIALNAIEKNIHDYITSLSIVLKERLTIKGKKTLEKKDIEEILKNQSEYWEI